METGIQGGRGRDHQPSWETGKNGSNMIISMVPQRLLTILLALTLLASSASAQSVFYCHMDHQTHWTCCCEGMHEGSPYSAHRKDACCCDIQLIESEPLRLNPPSAGSLPSVPFLVALPEYIGQTDFRWAAANRFRPRWLRPFQTAPPIFQQNCSYLI